MYVTYVTGVFDETELRNICREIPLILTKFYTLFTLW